MADDGAGTAPPATLVRTVIVDDEEELRELLRIRLERHGSFCVVGEGNDGPAVAELCAEHQPDLLILDALLPSGSGLDFVKEARRVSPFSAVLIYTADSSTATRNAAEQVGAHGVIGKLDPFERLVGTVFRLFPDKAPAVAGDDFGDRMEALLEEDDASALAGSGLRAWFRFQGWRRVAVVVVLLLVVLPLAAALVWVLAMLAGMASG